MTAAQVVRTVGWAMIVWPLTFTVSLIIAGWGPGPFMSATFQAGVFLVMGTRGKK